MSLLNDLTKKYVTASDDEVVDKKAMEKVCFDAADTLMSAISTFRKEIADTGIFRVDKEQKIDKQLEETARAVSDLLIVCKSVANIRG